MQEKLLTTREASRALGISEKEIIDLAESDAIGHFKVAGEFLRFRKEDVLKARAAVKKKYNLPEKKHLRMARVKEFFYFNDFYIASAVIVAILLWIIIKGIVK